MALEHELGRRPVTATVARIMSSTAIDAARETAADAYVYAYPLVLMEMTRRVMARSSGARTNQFTHMRAFPDAAFTDVVSPNADTLYSTAWLDLASGPLMLQVPDAGSRYYLLQMCDAWTNVFAAPGTRTTGNAAAGFAIVGPGTASLDALPADLRVIQSPTSLAWIVGRTETRGASDYAAVRSIQDGFQLTPLGLRAAPPRDADTDVVWVTNAPPADQVAAMDAGTFFGLANELMRTNPPAPGDASALASFATIGVGPGWPFDLTHVRPVIAESIEEGTIAGRARIVTGVHRPRGQKVNGWQCSPDVGRFGTDYRWRAEVALMGLGANLPDDAVYLHAREDMAGQLLTGARRYTVTFQAGQLPPVNAFWSITAYNSRQAFAPNPINRYAIGDRDALTFDPDGSVTLHVQRESPGPDRESNWLPTPADGFNLIMRLYWPSQEILAGTWHIPAIERAV